LPIWGTFPLSSEGGERIDAKFTKCKQNDVHYCCSKCKFACKKSFDEWSTNVPCYEFCPYFEKIGPLDWRTNRWKKFWNDERL